jgi:GH15 family glucan-1,4-alpha-glucosidase
MPLKIEDYALIGDLQTAALVGKDGSIDWLCLPDFSSPACFCALLGTQKNGRWKLAPTGHSKKTTRCYRAGTLILDTTFVTASGSVRVTDFMPIRGDHPDIVRVVRGLEGHVQMQSDLTLQFDYGRSQPWYSVLPHVVRAISGPHMVVLRSPGKHLPNGPQPINRFTIRAGQTVPFILTYGASHLPMPKAISWRKALSTTQKYWEKWSGKSCYSGPYTAAVERSLITLKALTFRPTGGIVAAPTTSLPEKPQGSRNWDYRYCWLRDATFTLLALLNAGYREEGLAWRDWLLRAMAGDANQIQIMYGIRGERDIAEWEISWLKGYKNSQPVRVGNAASTQFQLDIYGEVMDAMLHGYSLAHPDGSRPAAGSSHISSELMTNLIIHLEKVWNKPDQGIWEMRSPPKHYTYSKLMAWVALDRAVKLAKLRGDTHLPVTRWADLRDRIHRQICKNAFNRKMNSFVQFYHASQVDASLLFIPLVGFLPIADPRVAGTVAAVEKNLFRKGFVQRYNTQKVDDSLPSGEGAFLACSFWLVHIYKLQGRKEEAHKLFQRLTALTNDVGLLSEEYDTQDSKLVGNFPQAFSHIALINAAFALEQPDGADSSYFGRNASRAAKSGSGAAKHRG